MSTHNEEKPVGPPNEIIKEDWKGFFNGGVVFVLTIIALLAVYFFYGGQL